ncbi:MAG TPA: formate dehydrogenase accessory sulfurtransferase FdhD [Thermodesulfobacteriota bacterium]|nr:formate dehydrogenase accessory sulfurtransferase FdhD [Thermodesulfobacteriota bacterium]
MPGYYQYERGRLTRVDKGVVAEAPLTVTLNGRELVRFLCTPDQLEALVVGFLWLEGLIRGLDDIVVLRACAEDGAADVVLAAEPQQPRRRAITSGCGGGITFNVDFEAESLARVPLAVSPERLFRAYRELQQGAARYREHRGIHCSALCDPERQLLLAEDVGRHNTLDKLAGLALLHDVRTEGCFIVSSGRISSEMAWKAARMRVPLVASRTSPTALAIELAERLGITLVGYLREGSFNVYTHPARLLLPVEAAAAGVAPGAAADPLAAPPARG